jgi:hypothetical protein
MKYNIPSNVHIVSMTFEECRCKIQEAFDFEICLNSPYKLCDFRPSFGYVFNDIVKEYDFWGYCDVDLIWGNIRAFLTTELLESVDKVSNFGHCSIYRNSKKMNGLFKRQYKEFPSYKEIFSSPLSYIFDERIMKYICKKENINVFEKKNMFFDCDFRHYQMIPTWYQKKYFKSDNGFLVKYDNGNLSLIGCEKENVKSFPIMYSHFQKRDLKVEISEKNSFFVANSVFCNISQNVTPNLIKKLSPRKLIYAKYFKLNVDRMLQKILKMGKTRFYSYTKKQYDLIQYGDED